MVGKHTVCERCRNSVQASLTGGSGAARFLRAAVAGLLAAAAGALIYFGISALTGYEFGLVAIVVGLMVGGAVRWGSTGRGGRSYQALAMALTYTAIVTTYVPQIVRSFREAAHAPQVPAASPNSSGAVQAARAPTRRSSATTPTAKTGSPRPVQATSRAGTSAASQDDARPTPIKFLIGWGFVFAIAFVAPFLGGLRNIMGLIIIGIGLYEAWKMNRRVRVELSGPFIITPTDGQPTSSA